MPKIQACDEAVVLAAKAFDKVITHAEKTYRRTVRRLGEAADKAADKTRVRARNAYYRAQEAAWQEYDKALAKVSLKLWEGVRLP